MPGSGRLTITADLAAATASPLPAEGSGEVAPGADLNVHSPSVGRSVIVQVTDTGVGIDPESLAIAIQSELRAGTTVTMTLPVASGEQAAPAS
jgi:signal transduction histidine kinase